jgi:methanethiol S-methyltransferase
VSLRAVLILAFGALFAAGMTAYIAIGVALEERSLVRHLGADYERYRRDVPAIIPRLYRSPSRPDRR